MALLEQLLLVSLPLSLGIPLLDVVYVAFRSELVWSDEVTVLPEGLTSQGIIEYLDWLKCHAWSNLDQYQLLNIVLLRELFFMLVQNLV